MEYFKKSIEEISNYYNEIKRPLRGIEPLSGDPQSPILATVLQGPHKENLFNPVLILTQQEDYKLLVHLELDFCYNQEIFYGLIIPLPIIFPSFSIVNASVA